MRRFVGRSNEAEEVLGRMLKDVEQDVIEMAIENLIAQRNPKFE